jgi:hypothetical protein
MIKLLSRNLPLQPKDSCVELQSAAFSKPSRTRQEAQTIAAHNDASTIIVTSLPIINAIPLLFNQFPTVPV